MLVVLSAISLVMLLDVLHLFAELVDHRFELQAEPCDINGIRLRTKGVGLAVELLSQEVELASDGARFVQDVTRRPNVGGEPLQLFFDIGASCEQHRFLVQPVSVQGHRRIEQS